MTLHAFGIASKCILIPDFEDFHCFVMNRFSITIFCCIIVRQSTKYARLVSICLNLCFERTSTTATYICYWDIKVIKNWKHFDHQTISEVWSLQENSVCIWSNMSFSIVQSCISLWTLTLCSKSMFIYMEIFTNVIHYSRKSYPMWHLSIIGQRE